MYFKQRQQPKQIHNRAHIFILMAIYQLETVWLLGFFSLYTVPHNSFFIHRLLSAPGVSYF